MNTVLIVDDEPEIRQVVHQMLCGQDFNILEANGSWDVFDVCDSHADLDLLIIDDLLPRDSGVRVTERLLRAHPTLKKIVLCPALPLDFWPEGEQAILRRLPKEYLHWLYKPFTLEQFLKTVEAAGKGTAFALAA